MRDFQKVRRVIIKIGSSSLVNKDLSPNCETFTAIFEAAKALQKKNISLTIVSSGAVAFGMNELKLSKKPAQMAQKQACAAVGQAKLMETYNHYADLYGMKVGQVLVSHDDFQIRKRMLLFSDTLEAMFKCGVIPVINENDALAVEEIRVGDNDTLAALIAPMVKAELLVLFTDIDGFYDKNPRDYKDAKLMSTITKIDDSVMEMAGDSDSNVGTGGMSTKLHAAIISNYASCDMVICHANRIGDLDRIVAGEEIGSLFVAHKNEISVKDHWMIFNTNPAGAIIVDDGVKMALSDKRVSILPKGVIGVKGEFLKDSVIDILDINGDIIAKGRSNFSSMEIKKLEGVATNLVESIVGYACKTQIIHANDLVVVEKNYGKLK